MSSSGSKNKGSGLSRPPSGASSGALAPAGLALSPRARAIPVALVVLGAAAVAYGLAFDPERTWPNLLLSGFYVLSLSVGGMFFFAGQRLSAARWSAGLRRVPEALMLIVPVAAVLMLVIYFGRHTLYPWSHEGAFANDPPIAGRGAYLQVPQVFGRAAVTFVVWALFALWFRRTSLRQDRVPAASVPVHHRLNRAAALFAVVFAPSFTLAAYDWIISLEPHWFSTMFAVYAFAGTFVQSIAAVTLIVVVLQRQRLLSHQVAGEAQLHDLGKMLFAFSVFWAYIWVSQYLLIWYGNIPEEVPYFLKRTGGAWLPFFVANFLLNWVMPFTVLMSVKAKKNPRVLAAVSVALLVGRWLDLYVMIMPASGRPPQLGLLEVAIFAGYVSLAFLLVVRNLQRAPLCPVNDPVLADEASRHVAALESEA
jgi:hypothetical protein